MLIVGLTVGVPVCARVMLKSSIIDTMPPAMEHRMARGGVGAAAWYAAQRNRSARSHHHLGGGDGGGRYSEPIAALGGAGRSADSCDDDASPGVDDDADGEATPGPVSHGFGDPSSALRCPAAGAARARSRRRLASGDSDGDGEGSRTLGAGGGGGAAAGAMECALGAVVHLKGMQKSGTTWLEVGGDDTGEKNTMGASVANIEKPVPSRRRFAAGCRPPIVAVVRAESLRVPAVVVGPGAPRRSSRPTC